MQGLFVPKGDEDSKACLPTSTTPGPRGPQKRTKAFMATCLMLSGMLLYVRLDAFQMGNATSHRSVVYLFEGEQAQPLYQTLATQASQSPRPAKVDPPMQVQEMGPYTCLPRSVAVETLREPGPNSYVAMEERPSCAHELKPEEIVVGIWTSKATEAKVQTVLDTWGGKVALELLGSGV